MWNMGKILIKVWFVSFFIFFFSSFFSFDLIKAQPLNGSNPKLLVIISSNERTINENQRMVDLLLSHFSDNITFRSAKEVKKEDFNDVDYLFYFGMDREVIPKETVDNLSSFQGTVVSIGYNFEQLGEKFHFIQQYSLPVSINEVRISNDEIDKLMFPSEPILNLKILDPTNTKVLAWGLDKENQYPLFIQHNQTYYFASHLLNYPFSIPFAEILHDVLDIDHHEHGKRYGYIRLEDIHPLVDPKPLMKIAQLLKEKNIPYMIAVIPVYTNPKTKKQYHFSDSPKLLQTLKFMQDNGGSIVLHGYTHQFRLSETGEGFEFWDVDHNMPIYHYPDGKVELKTRADFFSEEEYEQYLQKQKEFERNYIEKKLVKGIEELANYGLYPLAFEAPHYTMSQHGYQVTSQFFSTYVGQVQLSDQDWRNMDTAPYMTSPQFLNGMKLLPETIGYVEDKEDSIEQMITYANQYLFIRDGMVAGFYHPYLGFERFQELLTRLEKFPNIEWIDLKNFKNEVKTNRVKITSNNGEMNIDIHHFQLFKESFKYLEYHINNSIVSVLWVFAGIGAFGIVTFIYCIIKIQWKTNRSLKRGGAIG